MNVRTLILAALVFLGLTAFQEAPKKQSRQPDFLQYLDHPWVDSLLQTLTTDQKIAQLLHIAAYSNRTPKYEDSLYRIIEKYQIGGLIFFQGDPVHQARMTNRYQEVSNIPMLISIDGEWGLGMRLDSTISFPYQMTLGAIEDPELIYQMGTEIARQCRRLGIHINYAPVIDVNNNPNNPVINFRSFGENKYNVAEKGIAYMRGLQDHQVLAVAKHFPGHGDTNTDSHYGLPLIGHDRQRLDSLELYPFRQLIDAGVGGMMVAHLNIPALDSTSDRASTLSKAIVTDLLQEELGFGGIIFTDALNMKGVASYFQPGEVDALAYQAGNDALLFSENVEKAINSIKDQLKKGLIKMPDLNNRVRKALALKYWAGLADYQPVETQNLVQDLNTPQARLLKQKLFEAAVTVLQNQENLIPLKNLKVKMASLSIGTGEATTFQKYLDKYVEMDHYQLKATASDYQIDSVFQALNGYDLVIAGLHNASVRPTRNYGLTASTQQIIDRLRENRPAILSVFGNPYTLEKLENLQGLEGLLLTYQPDTVGEMAAAQVIFGGIGANGKLPVSSGGYEAGTGIETAGGIRFGYTFPEEVGIDSRFLYSRIDSLMQLALDSQATPGAQVLIAKDGKMIFEKAYGHHTYAGEHPVELDDIYDFASITKITASLPALMKLDDEGKIRLDQTLGELLPDFSRSNKSEIELLDLLTHQGRLVAWIPFWKNTIRKSGKFKWFTFKNDSSRRFPVKVADNLYLHRKYDRKIYKTIRKSPLRDSVEYVYSDLGFYLYPKVVERITGKNFYQYLHENFYEPLGASTITFNPWQKYPLDRIVPTEYDSAFRKSLLHGRVDDEGAAMLNGISGHAGLFGTGRDLAKVMQMYLQMGEYGGNRYIAPLTLKEYSSCPYCSIGNRRGIGFDKPQIERSPNGNTAVSVSDESFGHSGFTGTFTWVDPANGLLYVFMSNRVHPTREHTQLYRLNTRTNIQEVIYQALGTAKEQINP